MSVRYSIAKLGIKAAGLKKIGSISIVGVEKNENHKSCRGANCGTIFNCDKTGFYF